VEPESTDTDREAIAADERTIDEIARDYMIDETEVRAIKQDAGTPVREWRTEELHEFDEPPEDESDEPEDESDEPRGISTNRRAREARERRGG
jgi:hypothetical protein